MTFGDFEEHLERTADAICKDEFRRVGPDTGRRTRVYVSVLADMVEKYIKACDYRSVALFIAKQDLLHLVDVRELLLRLSEAYEKDGRTSELKILWKGIYTRTKGEFAPTFRYMDDLRRQVKRGVHVDSNMYRGVESSYNFGKNSVVTMGGAYLSVLDRHGTKPEAQAIRDDLACFEADSFPKREKGKGDLRKMSLDVFWELIEDARKGAGNTAEVALQLVESLERFKSKDIISFQRIFNRLMDEADRWDLWGVAVIITRGSCSDDSFEYFRSWLISRGRRVFESAMKNPEVAAEGLEPGDYVESEDMLSVASSAYTSVAKNGGMDFEEKMGTQKMTGLKGTQWEESHLPKMFPKLCRRFGFPDRGAR